MNGATATQFLLLGPVEVVRDGVRLPVNAPMQRAVLASLLTREEQVVATDAVVEDLWGATPPSSARVTLRNYVRRLRLILPPDTVGSSHSGYFLRIEPEQVDIHRMTALGERARRLADTEPAHATSLFTQASALWRGAPLLGIGDAPLRTWRAPRLEEAYLALVEDSVDVRLRDGQTEAIVAELTELHGRYPLRERICAQLMLALYRTGRGVEASRCFRRLRAAMIERLGVEPGARLRALQESILRQDPALLVPGDTVHAGLADGRRGAAVPSAPPAPAGFVGRDDLLGEFGEQVGAGTAQGSSAIAFLLHGQGGVGKSALALAMAQAHGERFPDGTCYVDLRGSTPGLGAMTSTELLRALLSELGGADPDGPYESADVAALYRARLRGRRVLLILDNAVNVTQVRAALPDEPGCVAVVTSRSAAGAAPDVLCRHVAELPAADAVELLARSAGSSRVRAEPEAAARLVQQCGRLPLAIRAIGGRVASRPHWSLAEWVRMCGDGNQRLAQLHAAEANVRTSVALSVRNLATEDGAAGRDAAELFDRLGVLPVAVCTPAFVAALTGWPVRRADDALVALTDAHLAFSPRHGAYRLHDLVALLAAERAGARTPTDRAELVHRACRWYVAAARRGAERISGARSPHGLPQHHPVDELDTVEFDGVAAATAWLNEEIEHIVAVFQATAESRAERAAALAVPLIQALAVYFNITMRWREREALATVMLDLAGHDERLRPVALAQLVNIEGQRGNLIEAERLAAEAEPLFDSGAAELERTGMLMNRSTVVFLRGRTDEAIELCQRAVDMALVHGFSYLHAASLSNLATIRRMSGDTAEALRLLEHAVRIHQDCGNLYGQAMSYNVLLAVHGERADHRSVLRHGTTALALCAELGDGYCTAECHARTARSLAALGRDEEAAEHLGRAHEVMAGISERERLTLATLLDNIEFHQPWTLPSGQPS